MCEELSKSSVINVVSGLELTAVSVTSGMDPDVGHWRVLYVKDNLQVVLKHLDMARVHQGMLQNSIQENLHYSRVEGTLRAHLIETDIALNFSGKQSI